jgi:hypothetical protein
VPLNESQVRSARPTDKAHKLADGQGMFLYVAPNGSKLRRLKYRFDGKEKLLALGGYPHVSLRGRERRDAARTVLKDEKDPAVERKRERRNARLKSENVFEAVARELV